MISNTRLGLVRCEHCGRQFNAHSGARHIPWCAKQQSANRRNKLSAEKRQALERYKWRINYRPSNRIINRHRQNTELSEATQVASLSRNIRQANKSSINSSATLSSLSAGSLTSIGTTSVTSSNENHHQSQSRQPNNNYTRRQRAEQQREAGSKAREENEIAQRQLRRSISSLTLTKQRMGPACESSANTWARGGAGSGKRCDSRLSGSNDTYTCQEQQHQQNAESSRKRTKSVNDLSNMSEIVETLAKRIEKIYAQNQILLANLKGNKGLIFGAASERRRAEKDNEEEEEEDAVGDIIGDDLVRCHHCKSLICFEAANYCHKCGCKVRGAAVASSTHSSSPPPG